MGLKSGAQRASIPRGVVRGLVAAILATFLVAPGIVGASTVGSAATTTVTSIPYASATWLSAEQWYLSLVNCTRTGGWVLSDGTCRGYGSGHYSAYVRPLNLAPGISTAVSRPYAKLLAIRNVCSHFYDHDPGYRLRRAGYYGYTWGENIGCRDGYATSKAAVLASHLYYQAEKATNGGHWKNIKNAKFAWIGIGIWRYGSRTRLVTDFYHA